VTAAAQTAIARCQVAEFPYGAGFARSSPYVISPTQGLSRAKSVLIRPPLDELRRP
jgi:hypothetical protein